MQLKMRIDLHSWSVAYILDNFYYCDSLGIALALSQQHFM